MPDVAHPAPYRGRASALELAFVLLGPPLAWSLRLLVNYSLASGLCRRTTADSVLPQSSVWTTALVINLLGIAVALTAGYLAYAMWRRTRDETAGGVHHLADAGEGRTRFLALWGLLTSGLFLVAMIFDVVGLLMGLQCS